MGLRERVKTGKRRAGGGEGEGGGGERGMGKWRWDGHMDTERKEKGRCGTYKEVI